MLAYMFFPSVALLLGLYTLRVAGRRRQAARAYGIFLVIVGLAMASGLISAQIAAAAPHGGSCWRPFGERFAEPARRQ